MTPYPKDMNNLRKLLQKDPILVRISLITTLCTIKLKREERVTDIKIQKCTKKAIGNEIHIYFGHNL